MKIAYAQMKVAAGHPDINTEKILRLIGEARAHGAEAVIFPEHAYTGDMLGSTLFKKAFIQDCVKHLHDITSAASGLELLICPDEDRDDDVEFFGYDVKYLTKPFSLSRSYDFEKIRLPRIQVGCVGVQNTGKTIYTFDGGSAVINSRGEVVQRAEPFAECMNYVELEAIDKMPALAPVDEPEVVKIHRALKYGVKTFLEQIGLQKVVIGVSGGIDSAVAAALYVDVLGAENVYLVNMPSVFNSATTKSLSKRLAKNLGCKYFVVPIQESVDWTVK
ncbi:MAG: hypothetical protein IKD80_08700, partial [Selenomonadaceae bacterium]|nr:hypothetical protein [Selenomonadaceae bacterium]